MAELSVVTHWVLVPLMIAVILYDLRLMRLPDPLAILIALVFVASIPSLPSWQAVGVQVGVAVAFYAAGVAAHAAGLIGGGDVKVLSALILNIPLTDMLGFFLLFFVALFLGIVTLVLIRKLVRGPTRWKALNDTARYPVGLSIGAAGLAYLFGM